MREKQKWRDQLLEAAGTILLGVPIVVGLFSLVGWLVYLFIVTLIEYLRS